MQKILIVDNYDSFTYNLVHIVKKLANAHLEVLRNDELLPEDVQYYDKIILSPGPGLPEEAGIMKEVITRFSPHKSIFGVCLGMQGITEVFGGKLYNMDKVYHGIATEIGIIKNDKLFEGLPDKFRGGRYHSWAVDTQKLPGNLEITAIDENSTVMAIRHKHYDVKGVQFHPESIMTPYGMKIISNWLGTTVKEGLTLPTNDNINFNSEIIKNGYLFC
ncbi:MAG: aminodeoxychorismate/anthranilate synthase component II [Bacteroidales bacterium]